MRRKTPMKRGGRIKPKKRSAAEKRRIYGSDERIAFVKNLPCVVMLCLCTPSECMHIKSDGMGRKADARWIIPACHKHHREAHRIGIESFADRHFLFLADEADCVEAAWQRHQADRQRVSA